MQSIVLQSFRMSPELVIWVAGVFFRLTGAKVSVPETALLSRLVVLHTYLHTFERLGFRDLTCSLRDRDMTFLQPITQNLPYFVQAPIISVIGQVRRMMA